MHLSSLCSKHNVSIEKMERDLQELAASDLPVIIFGAGKLALWLGRQLERRSIFVEAFCESSAYYQPGKFIDRKPVYNYDQLVQSGKKCNLVIGATGKGVVDVIFNQKLSAKLYFFDDIPPMFSMTPEWVNEHIDALNETYQLLADEESKTVFLSFIEGHAHCLNISVAPWNRLFSHQHQYFNDLLDPNQYDSTVLADCGAWSGDSAEEYLQFMYARGRIGKVYAFEPTAERFSELKATAEKVKTLEIGEIECCPYAVGEEKGQLRFAVKSDISSYAIPTSASWGGIAALPVVALDEFLADTPVSMIKMDIEGGELAALKGAKRIITEQSPFLAICVYHRREDFITIPQYLRELSAQARRNYKFFMRAHSLGFLGECVLYAVADIR